MSVVSLFRIYFACWFHCSSFVVLVEHSYPQKSFVFLLSRSFFVGLYVSEVVFNVVPSLGTHQFTQRRRFVQFLHTGKGCWQRLRHWNSSASWRQFRGLFTFDFVLFPKHRSFHGKFSLAVLTNGNKYALRNHFHSRRKNWLTLFNGQRVSRRKLRVLRKMHRQRVSSLAFSSRFGPTTSTGERITHLSL